MNPGQAAGWPRQDRREGGAGDHAASDRDRQTAMPVVVHGQVAGSIELRASIRPEARAVADLHRAGIHHMAIVSGDHEAPTRALAETLGMDLYFAGVLPADKVDSVARLPAEGRKVCFVSDGINDSIALKEADVSISLRGASTFATDTAHVVFLFLEGPCRGSATCVRSRRTSTPM